MKRTLGLPLVAGLFATLFAPGASAATPTFDREWAIMPSVVVDEVLFTIPKGEGRWRRWRGIRDYTFASYAPIGLEVAVVEQVPTERPTTEYQFPGATMIAQNPASVPPGSIVVHATVPGTISYADVDDWSAPRAGIVGLDHRWLHGFGSRNWQTLGARRLQLRANLAHELGHVLGLDHSTDPWSVTGPWLAIAPTADDLAALAGPETGLPDPGDPGYW